MSFDLREDLRGRECHEGVAVEKLGATGSVAKALAAKALAGEGTTKSRPALPVVNKKKLTQSHDPLVQVNRYAPALRLARLGATPVFLCKVLRGLSASDAKRCVAVANDGVVKCRRSLEATKDFVDERAAGHVLLFLEIYNHFTDPAAAMWVRVEHAYSAYRWVAKLSYADDNLLIIDRAIAAITDLQDRLFVHCCPRPGCGKLRLFSPKPFHVHCDCDNTA